MTALTSDVAGLLAEVKADPAAVPEGALVDAWQEAGASPLAARRRARKAIRAAAADKRFRELVTLALADDRPGVSLRSLVRRTVGIAPSCRVPVRVVAGGAAPVVTGEAPYTAFKGGGVCRNPAGAIRAGYRVEYHRDTRVITVGADWLNDRI